MTLDVLIRKMVELEGVVEAGNRAAEQLNECQSIAENVMDPNLAYCTDFGTVIHGHRLSSSPRLHRLNGDCELVPVISRFQSARPVVDSKNIVIDPAELSGSKVLVEVEGR